LPGHPAAVSICFEINYQLEEKGEV